VRKLSRCGLLELYAESPSAAWLEFLSEKIAPNHEMNSTSDLTECAETESRGEIVPEIARAFAEWAVGIRTASLIPDSVLSTAAKLAEAARSGSRDELPLETISESVWHEIATVHRTAALRSTTQKRQGFTAVAPELTARDHNFNYLGLDVVCTLARNSGSGPYFLDVLCFTGSGVPFTLSDADLRAVIPEEGRVILHADSRLPAPNPGMAETYRVEYFRTQRAIKVRAIAAGAKLYQVMYVPHASDRKDQVRDWLKEHATVHQGRTIFVLADGLSIKPRGESNISLPGFDWVFDSWQGLEGVELTRAAYVTSPLPRPDGLYECAPVSVIARRYLKSLVERKDARLTKQQLTDLSNLLGTTDVLLTEEHRRRIKENLSTLESTDIYYDELVAEAMKSPVVQRDIEQRKQLIAAQVDEELARKRRALENLRKETVAQAERLDKLKQQTEERTREIRNAIKKAFEHAREHEAELLGQLALWQELLAPARSINAAPTESRDAQALDRWISFSDLDPQSERIQDILASIGMETDSAEAYASAIAIVCHVGLPIVVAGSGALHVGTRLGRALAQRSVCVADVGVGVVESGALTPVLNDDKHDVLILRHANLSDVGTYGAELLEDIVATASQPPSSRPHRAIVLIVEASGAAALPWPTEIEQLGLRLDLSRRREQPMASDEEWLRALPSSLQRKIWKRIEQEAERRGAHQQVLDTLRTMLWECPTRPD
jgi:hypothetical protein